MVTLQHEKTAIVVKDVPADVCERCCEYYLDSATTAKALALGEHAVRHRAEVEVLRFVA